MQTTPQCHAGSVDSAVLPALAKVPKPASVDEWQVYTAQGYDRCAALSWVVLAPKNATASSPFAIMLFHGGEYLGTATKDPQGFAPDITRTSDAAISVTYKYPQVNIRRVMTRTRIRPVAHTRHLRGMRRAAGS